MKKDKEEKPILTEWTELTEKICNLGGEYMYKHGKKPKYILIGKKLLDILNTDLECSEEIKTGKLYGLEIVKLEFSTDCIEFSD